MKFCKSLSILIEEALPDWRDKFLPYKDLKKQLKLIYPKDGSEKKPNKRPRLDSMDTGDGEESEVSKEVMDFVLLLENEVERFNTFFVEKEEDYVIKWRVNFLKFPFYFYAKVSVFFFCFFFGGGVGIPLGILGFIVG